MWLIYDGDNDRSENCASITGMFSTQSKTYGKSNFEIRSLAKFPSLRVRVSRTTYQSFRIFIFFFFSFLFESSEFNSKGYIK